MKLDLTIDEIDLILDQLYESMEDDRDIRKVIVKIEKQLPKEK
jgi:hypothetical protein